MAPGAAGADRRVAGVEAADATAVDELMPVVYEQLRELARRHLARQRPSHTLQTTDLVHEAYLKLAHRAVSDRAHFIAVASRAMRCVLVDHARGRGYAKRGRNPIRVSLSDAEPGSDSWGAEILAIHEALTRLAELDRRKSDIIELRYFGGLGVEEIAGLVGVSARTVKREWRWARAWLYRELGFG
jgi:RNA polymerase sigma factor (TIGR02999 family)